MDNPGRRVRYPTLPSSFISRLAADWNSGWGSGLEPRRQKTAAVVVLSSLDCALNPYLIGRILLINPFTGIQEQPLLSTSDGYQPRIWQLQGWFFPVRVGGSSAAERDLFARTNIGIGSPDNSKPRVPSLGISLRRARDAYDG
ncbi:hypothetical protein RSAG8_11166, partial [Rhizoctonia solani AG-8 WAC10335]